MEYLEKKGVKTTEEIKAVYQEAVNENYKFYRAISNSGKYYGWEITLAYPQGHHIPAPEGQDYWFVNDKYIEPIDEPIEEPIAEPVEEPVVEPVVEPIEEPIAMPVDYKALYETALADTEALKGKLESELAEKDNEILFLKTEIEQLKEYKAVVEAFKAL